MKRRYNPDIHRRRSIRLRGYDYTQSGAYYITIVTQDRVCLFGEVVGEEVRLDKAGEMAQGIWEALPNRYPSITIDESIVMPNHIHGIIVINRPVGASLVSALDNVKGDTVVREAKRCNTRAPTRDAPTLGDVIGAYKSLTTVEYARAVGTDGWQPFNRRLWQRNYYERVIRNDNELDQVREYIVNNPAQWEVDPENPDVKITHKGRVDSE